jgi:hypothetical protein
VKTQLLYLDSHDDSASTLEKLRWAQADRVVLVWPSHGRILHRQVDLVLLTREAARQAARLGVLSHDPDVRASARRLGLPVFDDLDAISRQPWPAKPSSEADVSAETERPALPPPPARLSAPGGRKWTDAQRTGSMLIVIAALLVLSIAIGPAAVVEVSPVEAERTLVLPVSIGDAIEPSSHGIAIPARSLEVEVEGEIQLPSVGTVQAATSAATGQVTFTNRSQDEVILPEGTGVRTLGSTAQRFETVERALVPAGIGADAVVPIRASTAGPTGNVAAGSIGAIEGTLGLALTVTNLEPTLGGDATSRPGVTQADLAAARAALERQLVQSANARLQEQLTDGEALAPDSFTIIEILDSEFHPSLGEASEVIQGAMTARIAATAYELALLQRAAEAEAAAATGPGLAIVPGSVRVDLLPPGSAGEASYQARVRARSRPDVDLAALARAIAGKSTDEAAAIVADRVELDSPPLFRLWPVWWPRLPFLPLRIEPVWASPAS